MKKQRITLATISCGIIGVGMYPLFADKADTASSAPAQPTYPAACDTADLPSGYSYPTVSPTMPYDRHSYQTTPSTAATSLDSSDCGVFETQKQFDLFSWGTFIALNWPADKDGKPFGDSIGKHHEKPRVWERYLSPTQIFKQDGSAPDAWGTPEHKHEDGAEKRVLSSISKHTKTHVLDEVNEAFFDNETPLPPIVDLNKEYVRYEIRINEAEYKYINDNKLYNVEGQDAFIKAGNSVSFPSGQSGTSPVQGAMELKVAWKKLTKAEEKSGRFYTIKPTVYHPYSKDYTSGDSYGLVGMHIMVRTKDASEWVWATFEHEDNAPRVDLRGDGTRKVNYDPNKSYSFWSADKGQSSLAGFSTDSYAAMLEAQKTNTAAGKPAADYSQPEDRRIPSQITQVITSNNDVIDSTWTNSLNKHMQNQLKGTVWEHYRLISTQWPVDSGQGRAGNPAPISLGNPVMETYMQVNGSCMNCHAGASYGPTNAKGDQPNMANFSFMLQRAHKKATESNKK